MSNTYLYASNACVRPTQEPNFSGSVSVLPSHVNPRYITHRNTVQFSAMQSTRQGARLASVPHWVAPQAQKITAEWLTGRSTASRTHSGRDSFSQLWGTPRNTFKVVQAPQLSLVNVQPLYMPVVNETQFPSAGLGTVQDVPLVRAGSARSAPANGAESHVVRLSSAGVRPSQAGSGMLPLTARRFTPPQRHLSFRRRSLTPICLKPSLARLAASLPPCRIASSPALGTQQQKDTGEGTTTHQALDPPRGLRVDGIQRRSGRRHGAAPEARKARSLSPSHADARQLTPLAPMEARETATCERSVSNIVSVGSRESSLSSGRETLEATRRTQQAPSAPQSHTERASLSDVTPRVVINLMQQEDAESVDSASLATTVVCGTPSAAPSEESQSHTSCPSGSDVDLDDKVDHMFKRIRQLAKLMVSQGTRRSDFSKRHHRSTRMQCTADDDTTRQHGDSSSSYSNSLSSENAWQPVCDKQNSTIVDQQCRASRSARRGRTTMSRTPRTSSLGRLWHSLRATLRRMRASSKKTRRSANARESRDFGLMENMILDMFACVEQAMETTHEGAEKMRTELDRVRTVLQDAALLKEEDKDASVVDIVSAAIHMLQCAHRENEEYRTEIHHLADMVGVKALLSSTARSITAPRVNGNDSQVRNTLARVFEELTRLSTELRDSHGREAKLVELVNLSEDKHDQIRDFCALLQHYSGEKIAFVLAKVYRLENENKFMQKRLQVGNVVEGTCPCCGHHGDTLNTTHALVPARHPQAALIEATERVTRNSGVDRSNYLVNASNATPCSTAAAGAAKGHTGKTTDGRVDHVAGALPIKSDTLVAPLSLREGTLGGIHSNSFKCYPADNAFSPPSDANLKRVVRKHTIPERHLWTDVGTEMDIVTMQPDSLVVSQPRSAVGYQANGAVVIPNATTTPALKKNITQTGQFAGSAGVIPDVSTTPALKNTHTFADGAVVIPNTTTMLASKNNTLQTEQLADGAVVIPEATTTLVPKKNSLQTEQFTDAAVVIPDATTLTALNKNNLQAGQFTDGTVVAPSAATSQLTKNISQIELFADAVVISDATTSPLKKNNLQAGQLANGDRSPTVCGIAMPEHENDDVTRWRTTEDSVGHIVDSAQVPLDGTEMRGATTASANAEGGQPLDGCTACEAGFIRTILDADILTTTPHPAFDCDPVKSDILSVEGTSCQTMSARMTFDVPLSNQAGEHFRGKGLEHFRGEGLTDSDTPAKRDEARIILGDTVRPRLEKEHVSTRTPRGSGTADASTVASNVTATHQKTTQKKDDVPTCVRVHEPQESFASGCTASHDVTPTDLASYLCPTREGSARDRSAPFSAIDVTATASRDGIDEMDAPQLRAELHRIRTAGARGGMFCSVDSSTPRKSLSVESNASILAKVHTELSKNMDQAERIASDHADLVKVVRTQKASVDLGAELCEELEFLRAKHEEMKAPAHIPSSLRTPRHMERKIPHTSTHGPRLADELHAIERVAEVVPCSASEHGTSGPEVLDDARSS